MLQQFLASEHEVEIAFDGAQAIEVGLNFKPDLIISDWKLDGGIDGVEACKQITKHNNAAVVFLSGSSLQQLKQISDVLSPLDFLSKPVNFKKLSLIIQSVKCNDPRSKISV